MLLADEIKKSKRIYVVGNGGSAANASHIVNDLLSCGRKAFDINQPFFSATANDNGYEESFSRWLSVVGEPGDLLLVLSGSGNSPNIIKALREGKKIGMRTYALLGYPAGKAASIADVSQVAGPDMQLAENLQLVAGHEVMWCLKNS